MLRDAFRLSTGTLTVVPVAPPQTVDRGVARAAMLIAPAAVVPIAVSGGAIAWLGALLSLPPLLSAVLVVGLVGWGSRAMHLDGLSDTADGLGASFERERALQVMSRGDAGPMGVATLVIVLLGQVAALAGLIAVPVDPWRTAIAVALVICASRGVLALACFRAVPSAKPDGLGALVAGSVGPLGVAVSGAVIAALVASAGLSGGRPWWLGLVGALVVVVVIAGWLRHCTRRLGGITGDVLGSCVEIALLVLVVVLAVPA